MEKGVLRCDLLTESDKAKLDDFLNSGQESPLGRITKRMPSGKTVYMAAKKRMGASGDSPHYDLTIKIMEAEEGSR